MAAPAPRPWTLVIPAYNEEGRISGLLADLGDFEGAALFVCDGSDRTAALIREHASRHPETAVEVLEFSERQGKGGGVMAGMLSAKTPLVGFVDADGSTPMEEMNRLFSVPGPETDGAIGSRWLKGSRVPVPQGFLRRVQSRLFNLFVRALFGLSYRDTQCGAKVFTRDAIGAVAPLMRSRGFEFDVELLWRLKEAGFRVVEVPTVWRNRGDSRVGGSDGFGMFAALLRIRLGKTGRQRTG